MASELSEIFNQKIKPHYPLGLTPDIAVQNSAVTKPPEVKPEEEKPQSEEVNTPKMKSDEKSFYEKHNKLLKAAAFTGAAIIGIKGYNHFRLRNLIPQDLTKIINNLSRESKTKFKSFTQALQDASCTNKAETINNMLKESDSELRFASIKYLTDNEKYIELNNFREIYDSLLELKPDKKIKEASIQSAISEFFQTIDAHKDWKIQIADKMLSSLKSEKITDNIKLQVANNLITKIESNKYSPDDVGIICSALMKHIKENKAENFCIKCTKKRNYTQDKFTLGYRLSCATNNPFNKYTPGDPEEKMEFVRYLQNLLSESKRKNGIISNKKMDADGLKMIELKLKSDIFSKKMTSETTIEDIDKFTDEILGEYKDLIENFKLNTIVAIVLKSFRGIQTYYENSLRVSVYNNIQKLRKINSNDPEKLKHIENMSLEIENKIEGFRAKYFYNNTGSRRTSAKPKGAEAKIKNELVEILSGNKDFEEVVNQIKSGKLDLEIIKKLKKRIAVKYHPDKVGGETQAEQEKATATFQRLNEIVAELEKIYEKK